MKNLHTVVISWNVLQRWISLASQSVFLSCPCTHNSEQISIFESLKVCTRYLVLLLVQAVLQMMPVVMKIGVAIANVCNRGHGIF